MSGGVHSVATAIELLECFAQDEELGVSEIARHLGVAKSTAHRMLTTLVAGGLIETGLEPGRYRLGMRLYELGQLAVARNHIRAVALPTLVELRRRSGLTVQLAVPDGTDVVYAERLETNLGVGLLRRTGTRLPAHTTSSGKAIAAFNPAFADRIRAGGFPRRTSLSLRSRTAWDQVLADTRRQYGAISHDEATIGVILRRPDVRPRW